MFDIILTQLPAGHHMIPGGKEFGGCPEAGDYCFTHALFGFPFDNLINGYCIVSIQPEGQLAVSGEFFNFN